MHLARISGWFEIVPTSGCGGDCGMKMGRSRRKQPVHWREKNRSVANLELELLALWEAFLALQGSILERLLRCAVWCAFANAPSQAPHALLCRVLPWLRRDSDSARGKEIKNVGPLLPLLPLVVQKQEGAMQCFVMPLSSWGSCSARGRCAWTVPGQRWIPRRRRGVFGWTNAGNEWPLLLCFGNVACTSQLPVEDTGTMPDCALWESPHLALQVRTLSPPFFGSRLIVGRWAGG